MANMTIEQQIEREQEYHRIEALRLATSLHAATAGAAGTPSERAESVLRIAGDYFAFIKNGKEKPE